MMEVQLIQSMVKRKLIKVYLLNQLRVILMEMEDYLIYGKYPQMEEKIGIVSVGNLLLRLEPLMNLV